MSVEFLSNNRVNIETEKMQVNVDENSVLVDGRIMVEKTNTKYKVHDKGAPYGTKESKTHSAPVTSDRDPHHYMNGHNGLTVIASMERAHSHVEPTLAGFGPYDSKDGENLFYGLEYLIVNNFGRDAAYRIAGGIAKAYRDGYFKGIPSALVFKLVATGEMQMPVKGDDLSLSDRRRAGLTFR